MPDPKERWRDHAKCLDQDPEPFFRWLSKHDNTKHYAEQLCAGCPVTDECLTYALQNDIEHGIWGGTTPQDRARLTHTKRQHW